MYVNRVQCLDLIESFSSKCPIMYAVDYYTIHDRICPEQTFGVKLEKVFLHTIILNEIGDRMFAEWLTYHAGHSVAIARTCTTKLEHFG